MFFSCTDTRTISPCQLYVCSDHRIFAYFMSSNCTLFLGTIGLLLATIDVFIFAFYTQFCPSCIFCKLVTISIHSHTLYFLLLPSLIPLNMVRVGQVIFFLVPLLYINISSLIWLMAQGVSLMVEGVDGSPLLVLYISYISQSTI